MPTHLIYSSTASHAMTRAELQTILEDARSGNAAHDVTGLLVYVDGVFLQILEGERDTLTSLVSRITNDTRHRDLQIFYRRGRATCSRTGAWPSPVPAHKTRRPGPA
jgi:hypothetical protein